MADFIELTDFSVDCIVGILDRERVTPQALEITVRLYLDLDGAAFGDLTQSVNYAAVAEQLRFLAIEGRWYLLESFAAAACALLLAPPAPGEGRAAIDRVVIGLRKPQVLGGVAVPGLRVDRRSGWRTLAAQRPAPGVTVEALQVTEDVGAYRVHWAAGAPPWAPPVGAVGLPLARTESTRTALILTHPPL